MKIKRICIVDVGSIRNVSEKKDSSNVKCPDTIGINQRNHEPIGACYIASWLKKSGYKVTVIYPQTNNLSVEEVVEKNPQIVAFSSLTYNFQKTKELTEMIKKIFPQIITVIGGYHATAVPQDVSLERCFDFVVAKEADWTLGDISDFINGKRKEEEIRGLVYKDGKIWINNFERFDPNLNPIPYRTKEMMLGRSRQGLYYPATSQQQSVALFVWSRGCKFNCNFCMSKKMFPSCKKNDSVKYRDISNIIDEIKLVKNKFGTNFGFSVDLNFYGGDKERVKELCQELSKTGLRWYAMSRLDVDLEMFDLMKIGGCTSIGFGVESLTRQRKNGGTNILDWQLRAKEVAKYLGDIGILSKYYYILGGPGETIEDIKKEGEEICNIDCNEIRLSWMVFSPDTNEFNKMKKVNGLEKNGDDFSLFSTDYPIIKVAGSSPEELQTIRMGIYKNFYNPKRYGNHAKNMIIKFPYLKKSFMEFNILIKNSLGRGFL